MLDFDFKYLQTIRAIKKKIKRADIALILGSGLGDYYKNLNIVESLSTSDLPDYPKSTVEGHAGKIHLAENFGKMILIYQGRIHFYEGYKIYECVLPIFISKKLGCDKILLTNAAGGIADYLSPGDLMLITSFNSIFIKKEMSTLLGLADLELRNKLLNFPSKELNNIIKQVALENKIDLKEGTYFYVKGPSYETPAEIRMMQKVGAAAVGMSTAHEAFFALKLGMECSAISCITNYAAGLSFFKLSHEEVTITANLAKDKFQKLLDKTLQKL